MYKVYGDYGYVTEQLLAEFATESEAVAWAEEQTDVTLYEQGDLGGYDIVEVARFVDEEYVPVWTKRLEDYEHYQEPTEQEEWYDFDPDC